MSLTSKRSKICQEILEVERKYVTALRTLEMEIRLPITKKLGSQAAKLGLGRIFGNVKIILELNNTLLLDLEDADQDSIGSVFLQFAPFLKMYTAYLNHTEDSLNLLQDAKKSCKVFKDFCARQPTSLESLLIRPVQQIPRYVMLMKELLKHTPKRHTDRENIEKAMDLCAAVATHCNATITKQKNFIKTVEVNERFRGQGLLESNDRQIVKEGVVEKVNRRGIPEERVFVLFSDALAYGTGVAENVKLHRIMYMGNFGIFDSKHDDEEDRCFEVRSKSKGFVSRAKAFVVKCATAVEKSQWMAVIRKTMEAAGVSSEQKFAAVWSHDTKECEVCDQSFGMLRRRHHCRNCGKCVCSACSPNHWMLPLVSTKPQRVCNMCYVRLKNQERENGSRAMVVVREGDDVTEAISSDYSSASMTTPDVPETSSSSIGRKSKERPTSRPPPIPTNKMSEGSKGRRRTEPPTLPRSRKPPNPPRRPPKTAKPKLPRPSVTGPKVPTKKRLAVTPSRRRSLINKERLRTKKKGSLDALRGKSLVSKFTKELGGKKRKKKKKKKVVEAPPDTVRKAAHRSSLRRSSQAVPSDELIRRLSFTFTGKASP
eukprot:g290.t1